MIGFVFRLFSGAGSLPWIIGGIMLVITSGFAWLKIHDYNVWEEATAAFNKAQEELVQKKQEEFTEKTEVINDNAIRIKRALERQQEIADQNNAEIEKKAKEETKTSNPVSDDAAPYLKSIVKQLDSLYGEKKK